MLPCYEYFLVTLFLHLLLERSAEIVLSSQFPNSVFLLIKDRTGCICKQRLHCIAFEHGLLTTNSYTQPNSVNNLLFAYVMSVFRPEAQVLQVQTWQKKFTNNYRG